MAENNKNDLKLRSREVTDGASRAPARAMLRAVGMGEEDRLEKISLQGKMGIMVVIDVLQKRVPGNTSIP